MKEQKKLERFDARLVITVAEQVNFHIYMDNEHPNIEVDSLTHRVVCECGRCHDEFVKEYLEYLGVNN